MRKLEPTDFVVPSLLLLLSVVPILGGILRLNGLATGTPLTAENARFVAAPGPVVAHVVTAALYAVIGAVQFSSGFRLRWPGWHRRAGRALAVCGLVVGVTGVWMAVQSSIPSSLQGPLLRAARVSVGGLMVVSIIVAWRRILQRDVASHEAWMIRAYALAQGAGTQALLLGPSSLVFGEVVGRTRDALMTAAWLLNLLAAEWVIHRRKLLVRAGRAPVSRLV